MTTRPSQLGARRALRRYSLIVGPCLIGVLFGGCSEVRLQHHLQATLAEVYWATYCFPKDDKQDKSLSDLRSNLMKDGKVTYTLTTMVGTDGQITTPYGFSLSPTFQRTHEIQVEINLNTFTPTQNQCQELEELPKHLWEKRIKGWLS